MGAIFMKMKLKWILLSGLCAWGLAGCANMSAAGQRVEVVSVPPPGGRFVGNVYASSPLAGWAAKDVSYQNALNKALNEAGSLGATHLVLDGEQGARFWGVSQSVRGRAYRR